MKKDENETSLKKTIAKNRSYRKKQRKIVHEIRDTKKKEIVVKTQQKPKKYEPIITHISNEAVLFVFYFVFFVCFFFWNVAILRKEHCTKKYKKNTKKRTSN